MQSAASGLRLVFLIALLIPGYAAVRSYLWANIALDDTSRLTKLVLMSIGGFASLSIVSFLRKWEIVEQKLPLGVPHFFTIQNELTLSTIPNLSILQATGLIVSQTAVAVVGGFLAGAGRIILIDGHRKRRNQISQPWEDLFKHVGVGDELTVVTHQGEKITGHLQQMGNPSRETDLLLTDPKRTFIDTHNHSESEQNSPIGQISYHHDDDISRIVAHRDWTPPDRGYFNTTYMKVLQKGLDCRKAVVNPLDSLKRAYSWIQIRIWLSSREESDIDKLDLSDGYEIRAVEGEEETGVVITPIDNSDSGED